MSSSIKAFLIVLICVAALFWIPSVFGNAKTEDNEKEIIVGDDTFESSAIKVSVGRYVIFQKGNVYGAFKITQELKDQEGWQYEWVLGADESGKFDGKTSMQGTGKIFESYKRIGNDSGGHTLIDKGSNLHIKIGPDIMFEWSYPLWVYPPDDKSGEETRIAVTNVSEIGDLKTSDLK